MRIKSMAIVGLTVLGLSVAACDRGAAETAKAGSPTTAPAQGADTAGAEAFVRALFAAYSDGPEVTGPENQWSAGTQALLDADGEAAQGVGYLGADPICDCQDWMNLRVTSLAVTSTGIDTADAAVVFVNGEGQGGTPTAETLKLVRENGAWKVDDIVYGQGHSMVGEPPLKQGVAASTAAMLAEDARGQ